MKLTVALATALALLPAAFPSYAQETDRLGPDAQYMGQLSANPYADSARFHPDGTFDNPYGSSATSPKLYDQEGEFRGNLNANPYDPDGVANPYGRYGSKYSPDSVNNPYGRYGSEYSQDSPNNPYGRGLPIYR